MWPLAEPTIFEFWKDSWYIKHTDFTNSFSFAPMPTQSFLLSLCQLVLQLQYDHSIPQHWGFARPSCISSFYLTIRPVIWSLDLLHSTVTPPPSVDLGKCWMDALELALHCSSLLMRTMTKELRDVNSESPNASQNSASFVSTLRQQLDDSDCERHFKLCGQSMTAV